MVHLEDSIDVGVRESWHTVAFSDILCRSLTISPAEVGNAGGEVIFQEECGGSGHVDCGLCHLDLGHKSLLADNVGHSGGANIVPYPAISPSIDMPPSSATRHKTRPTLHIFFRFFT